MSEGSKGLPPRTAASRPGGAKKTAPKPKKKKKKGSVWIKIMFAVLSVLILIMLYVGYLAYVATNAVDTIGTANNIVVPEEESVKKKPTGMVLLGIDSREKGGGLNTDVMLVAIFNPNSKSASVISIPRDSVLQVDGYRERKANANYSTFFNNARSEKNMDKEAAEKEAKKEIREMLSKYFGVDLKYTGIINFKGFTDVVDALDGVEVNVEMDMRYRDTADGTNINLSKGQQVLDGKNALDYVRYRKSNQGTAESSDFDRNRREMEVIGAIFDKMKSFEGVTKYDKVIGAVGSNLTLDMPPSEIKNMLSTYLGMGSSDITFQALNGTWKSPYVYVDSTSLEEARAVLQAKMAE
ncbi:LCP family protein [Paenibacillus sp. Leaf72]|uniref:LCP family protein n=1 Tax=Paenibacillus sp. Leaf72 TaxID=1736234 RepID=UPI0006FD2D7C|nr:LCP family protein [Paenibacillus sp. Leaf72]KQN97658.1 transcriptional regulator [Paenibacillus sp. Leaf72]